MTLDPMQLAGRLRDAREKAGYTQQVVAKALGISLSALKHLETGKRPANTLDITRLAQLYGESVKGLLGYADPCSESNALLALFHDAHAHNANGNWQQDAARCFAVCRTGTDLRHFLGLAIFRRDCLTGLTPPLDRIEATKQGTDAAKKERVRLRLGSLPIPDMAYLINNLGIWATDAELPPTMSGAFLDDPDIGAMIFVNANRPTTCKRLSYAHEYAHAVFGTHGSALASWDFEKDTLHETRARAFSTEFLLPEDGVRAFLASSDGGASTGVGHSLPDTTIGKLGSASPITEGPIDSQKVAIEDVARLSRHYGAAFETVVHQLRNMLIISEEDSKAILSQEPLATQYLKTLYDEDPRVLGKRDKTLMREVAYLAIKAFRRKAISGGRVGDVARLLQMSLQDLLNVVEATSA